MARWWMAIATAARVRTESTYSAKVTPVPSSLQLGSSVSPSNRPINVDSTSGSNRAREPSRPCTGSAWLVQAAAGPDDGGAKVLLGAGPS